MFFVVVVLLLLLLFCVVFFFQKESVDDFLTFLQKHMLWVLIRSALVSPF